MQKGSGVNDPPADPLECPWWCGYRAPDMRARNQHALSRLCISAPQPHLARRGTAIPEPPEPSDLPKPPKPAKQLAEPPRRRRFRGPDRQPRKRSPHQKPWPVCVCSVPGCDYTVHGPSWLAKHVKKVHG